MQFRIDMTVKTRLFAMLFILTSPHALSERMEGRVVSIQDGDTATVLLNGKTTIKVRLAQIDAPERKQAFGAKSAQSLAKMIFGKRVEVEGDLRIKDRYGRVIGQIFSSGVDINLAQVSKGMAWVYRKYSSDDRYLAAETVAMTGKLGLWKDNKPIPPWLFRKNHTKRIGSFLEN